MPLMKQRGFKFSILCDVFLLLTTHPVLVFPVESASGLEHPVSTEPSQIPPIPYTDSEDVKSLNRFEAYNDFSKIPYDTIHRILRDEETVYRNDEQRLQKRWKKSTSSDKIFHKLGKRSTAGVYSSIELFFNNRNKTSSDDSTKALDLASRNLTKFELNSDAVPNLKQSNRSEVSVLNLANNLLSDIDGRVLSELVNLQYLDLSRNRLKVFNLSSSCLKILNLSSNQISSFTSTRNENLRELHLRNNDLSSVKHLNLSNLLGLQSLDLSCNRIQEVDRNFLRQAKTLKRLNLSGNQLGGIFKEPFYNLLNIDTLILSYNNISAIDLDTFLVLPNLQYLDLSHNSIQGGSIRALQGIPDLVGLSIAYNPDLGDSLQEFVASWSLKELDASGTGLCRIPAALAQSVRTLKLVDNWFSVIRCGDLDSYPLLQYLDISSSHINEIEEDALGRLEILETLFLDHNNLKRIPVSLPTSLEHLFLQNNLITDVQPHTFQTLTNLKTLDLSWNMLVYLPGLPLPKLVTLNLQSSELRGLSQSVVKTSPKLRDLLLDGNPIKCSDLLGIAEWASPCQSDRITEQRSIKERFQKMHNYFQGFGDNIDERSGCGYVTKATLNNLTKPICADSNVKFIQSNKLETLLQGTEVNSKSKRVPYVNLLHLLSPFLEEPPRRISFKEEPEEEHNFIQGKQEHPLKVYGNQKGRFLGMADIPGKDDSSSTGKSTAVPNENERSIKIPSQNGHINRENPADAKTPILSSLFNSSGSTDEDVGSKTPSQSAVREQQLRAILSKIKSDNNYAETSVLLDGGNRSEDLITQKELKLDAEDSIGSNNLHDGDFKPGNIDSLPKMKANVFPGTEHTGRAQAYTNSSNKIDEGNIDKFWVISGSRINNEGKNINRTGTPKPVTTRPSAVVAKLSRAMGNSSETMAPASLLLADNKSSTEGNQETAIKLSEAKTNLPKSSKGDFQNRETIKVTITSALTNPTTGPPATTSPKMATSKVNKADKVIFLLDQPSAIAENGIIKGNQNVSLSLGQHYHQIQKPSSKPDHQPAQRQKQKLSAERKMQKRPKLRGTATAKQDNNRYNPETQQKLTMPTLAPTSEGKIVFDKHQKFGEKLVSTTKSPSLQEPSKEESSNKFNHLESSQVEHILGKGTTYHSHYIETSDREMVTGQFAERGIKKIGKILHTLNTPKDFEGISDEAEEFEISEAKREAGGTTKSGPEEYIHKLGSHHTVNSPNILYTPNYMTMEYRSEHMHQAETAADTPSERISSHLQDDSNQLPAHKRHDRVSSSKSAPILAEIVARPNVHLQNNSSSSNNDGGNGLPPEQWLDIRTSGHPGLLIVIGVTFGMLLTLGLIHVYRCRKPWLYAHHGAHVHNHSSRGRHRHNNSTASADYCHCDEDDYYIEMDQESQSSMRRDFLPMELLGSSTGQQDRHLDVW